MFKFKQNKNAMKHPYRTETTPANILASCLEACRRRFMAATNPIANATQTTTGTICVPAVKIESGAIAMTIQYASDGFFMNLWLSNAKNAKNFGCGDPHFKLEADSISLILFLCGSFFKVIEYREQPD